MDEIDTETALAILERENSIDNPYTEEEDRISKEFASKMKACSSDYEIYTQWHKNSANYDGKTVDLLWIGDYDGIFISVENSVKIDGVYVAIYAGKQAYEFIRTIESCRVYDIVNDVMCWSYKPVVSVNSIDRVLFKDLKFPLSKIGKRCILDYFSNGIKIADNSQFSITKVGDRYEAVLTIGPVTLYDDQRNAILKECYPNLYALMSHMNLTQI